MILMVCLDENNGMLFHQRRQSQDRALRKRVLSLTAGKKLRMSTYSKKQFDFDGDRISADDNYMEKAKSGDYCFVEGPDYLGFEDRIEKIIIFRWHRKYPADVVFSLDLPSMGWKQIKAYDFAGYSHEIITEEVYVK